MRFLKQTIGLFASVAVSSILLMGCDEAELYNIDSPDWMQDQIDSIADAKSSSATSGDTTFVTLTSTAIGLSDCSAGWWTYFTQSFEIPTGQLLHLEFVNHTAGAGNYQNWNLALVNVGDDAHSTDDNSSYFEYCVLRSDAYGWGGSETATYPYESAYISYNYADVLGIDGDDMWALWLSKMEGAYVTMEIDHSTTGYTYVTATMETTDGYTFVETFQQATSSSESVYAFIVVDGSYLEMQPTPYLIPSKVTVVEDQDPVSLTVTGAPTSIEIGNEDYIGDAVFTVTYADGSSEEVSSDDITFTVPDLTTVGEKVIIATYGLTKEGAATSSPVSAYYTLSVTNAVTEISVTAEPTISTYYYYSTYIPQFDSTGLEVEATYADGTTGSLDISTLTFSSLTASSTSVTATYAGSTSSVTCEIPVTMVEGVAAVGAADYSNGWWTTFSEPDLQVTTSSPVVYDMYVYSDNAGNWHSPCVILRDADLNEYAVVRMDNYGWGGTVGDYSTAILESDWDWDTFTSNINGSHVVITITATSDTTADIYYDVTYATGEAHYQSYSGITVDASNLYSALVTEESLLILTK